MNKKPAFVLGMHRSGTSMITGAMTALGMHVGPEQMLVTRDQWNQDGYFEYQDIVTCNERILSEYITSAIPELTQIDTFINKSNLDGFAWIFGAYASICKPSNNFPDHSDSLVKSCLNIILSTAPLNTSLAIKDPRLVITFEAWQKVISDAPLILVVRNPIAVASSLYAREKEYIPNSLGLEIWAIYNLLICQKAQNHPHLVLDYDKTLEDPQSAVTALYRFLSAQGCAVSESRITNSINFLNPQLKHHKSGTGTTPPEWITSFYDTLSQNHLGEINHISLDFFSQQINIIASGTSWLKGLYLPSRYISNLAKCENMALHSALSRLHNHIIAGSLIRFIAKLKKDTLFGMTSTFAP